MNKTAAPFKEISIVIPAFNEMARIGNSLEKILAYLTPRFANFEVLVVDDGSTDRTVEVVNGFSHAATRCLMNPGNRGKGYSVRRGMLAARYDPVLFSDADLSTPIEELDHLIAEIERGHDIAIGSRWCRRNQEVHRKLFRKLQGLGFARLVRATTLRGFHDTQCGFKMFRRSAAAAIFELQRIDRWGFDVEILFIARKLGLKVKEVPVRWFQMGGSKLKFLTPLTMVWDLARIRWNNLLGRYRPATRRQETPAAKE